MAPHLNQFLALIHSPTLTFRTHRLYVQVMRPFVSKVMIVFMATLTLTPYMPAIYTR